VVVARYFEPSERGRKGLGAVLGGLVSDALSRAYLFLIPVLMLISILFLNRELPSEPHRKGTVDVVGAVLVALTVDALIVYLNFCQLYNLAAILGLLALFALRIRTARDPFIKPSLFMNARFSSGVWVLSLLGGRRDIFVIPFMLYAESQIMGLEV